MAGSIRKPTKTAKPSKAQVEKLANPKKRDSTGYPPASDTRLTINMDKDIHRKLKIRAVEEGTTMGNLIEKMASAYLEEK